MTGRVIVRTVIAKVGELESKVNDSISRQRDTYDVVSVAMVQEAGYTVGALIVYRER